MEEILERILAKVLIIKSTLSAESDLLNLVAQDVLDRAIIYTNRSKLVEPYEEALISFPDAVPSYEGSIEGIRCPIPPQLETTLANTIVGAFRTIEAQASATKGAVKSVSDQGQSVTYGDQLVSYLASSSDTEIFSTSIAMLDKFRLPTVVENY